MHTTSTTSVLNPTILFIISASKQHMKGPSLCYLQHYFQSGKGYVSSSGLTGKSLLTIEWTNQHGCNDRDLNCNFVLQYRCQDDNKHKKLNHHTMRNGKKVVTLLKARIPRSLQGEGERFYKV